MDDYDDDYVIPLTRIEFEKEQRKNLRIGLLVLGIFALLVVSCGVWVFNT
jgi:hypothetical protein